MALPEPVVELMVESKAVEEAIVTETIAAEEVVKTTTTEQSAVDMVVDTTMMEQAIMVGAGGEAVPPGAMGSVEPAGGGDDTTDLVVRGKSCPALSCRRIWLASRP